MKNKFLLTCILFLLFLLPACKADPLKDADVVWEKGGTLSNADKLSAFASAEDESLLSFGFRGVFGKGSADIGTLKRQNETFEFSLHGQTVTFPYLLAIRDKQAESGRTYYVLTKQQNLSFRELWREMWLRPDERNIPLYVLCWTGSSEEPDSSGLDSYPEEYRDEAQILLGIDDLPLAWSESLSYESEENSKEAFPEKGVLWITDETVTDMAPMEAFVTKTELGMPARILFAQEYTDSGSTVAVVYCTLAFDGEFFDYQNYYLFPTYQGDFCYLKNDTTKRNGYRAWYLCPTDLAHPSSAPSYWQMDYSGEGDPFEEDSFIYDEEHVLMLFSYQQP